MASPNATTGDDGAGPRGRARFTPASAKRGLKRLIRRASEASPAARAVARALIAVKRRLNYRKHVSRRPLDSKMVVFESFVGRKYACNPRALYEAVLADPRFDDFKLVWAFRDPDAYRGLPAFERAELVRYASQEYYARHAEAKYWISNSVVFPHMRLRKGQVYVQTWHGTPLKRLGCDLEIKPGSSVKYDRDEKRAWYQAEGRRFTTLLAQSPFAARTLGSAFDLAASGRREALLVEGYPRNDYLHNHSPQDRVRIREELGLPADKQVVLYAPTWRDDQHQAGLGYTLDVGVDFDALRRELGDTHVILFRAHFLIANSFDFESQGGFVRDVSQIDDINELYVASDMLITDYSSVFFDYANLRRPIVFYMYDLSSYADTVRGFYLDLTELPGPIVETQDDLVDAIRSAGRLDERTAADLEQFASVYTALDDGGASERVLSHMLASPGHTAAR